MNEWVVIRKHIQYDPKKGTFNWKVPTNQRIRPGQQAGTLDKDGYLVIRIFGKWWKAHRLAWMLFYNEAPPRFIDHIDGNKRNNCIDNLRAVTHRQNMSNQKSHRNGRLLGANYKSREGRWCSQIRINGKPKWLGYFNSEEDAHAAYMSVLCHIQERRREAGE
jgi:hypothetical protein